MTEEKRETIREILMRLGYLHEVMADGCREFADQPPDLVAFLEALDLSTHEGPGQDIRRMIEIFDAYATMVRDTTGERVIVGDLVDCLWSVVGEGKSGT